ncbi:MAG: SCO1664 family protein [Actinomycetota bacterium]|nr:SCO1664 family protein [Actinomycetota bacterium]
MTAVTGGLLSGDVIVLGRILPASNHTFFAEVVGGGGRTKVVYKPVSGERPLWDFTDGTLANREYAAWLVSEALGWSVVPPTVLRDGPTGHGMVQLWCEPDPSIEAVDIVPQGSHTEGFLKVLDAVDDQDRPVQLVHEDSEPLRRMAIFDVVVNNTDRKGGHVLSMSDGRRYGVDHGICFHTDDKLRTVLWGWAGEPLTSEETTALRRLADELDLGGQLETGLSALLTAQEISRTRRRVGQLLDRGTLPIPSGGWPAIPWPPF